MNKTVNKVKPAYTFYLQKNLRVIETLVKRGTKEELVAGITKLIKPAASTYVNNQGRRLPTKKKRFVRIINSKKMDNEQILKFCLNSIAKAARTEAKYNNLPLE